ncbi:unnamed protein product [Rotaria magnacalcarata]|uniref:Uncharacterized protein n=1 Tax=Rotaria magnacalcarata TaxID=392030 RepID=A0A816MWR9_9BILA|nr:unnamed protein product [Rotaria magnacalcarata]CAF3944324.1 unnamed protein product [Rotaria magnacalcarata]
MCCYRETSVWLILAIAARCVIISEGTIDNFTEIIKVNEARLMGRNDGLKSPKFYFKYQPEDWSLNIVSYVFSKVPGLSFAFHHTKPLVYSVRFQGTCATISPNRRSFVKIMIDDQILSGNQLMPNTARRASFSPEGYDEATKLVRTDQIGGLYLWSQVYAHIPCIKLETFLLPPGVHTIDVVARTEQILSIYGGELHIRLAEFDSSINLPELNSGIKT